MKLSTVLRNMKNSVNAQNREFIYINFEDVFDYDLFGYYKKPESRGVFVKETNGIDSYTKTPTAELIYRSERTGIKGHLGTKHTPFGLLGRTQYTLVQLNNIEAFLYVVEFYEELVQAIRPKNRKLADLIEKEIIKNELEITAKDRGWLPSKRGCIVPE